jgi:hypothetical protein
MTDMGQPQRVPNKTELRRYLSSGLTQQQIADKWLEDSGEKVSRSAIGMAIERYGLTGVARSRPSYSDLIPWTLAPEHRFHTDVRMLRLEGRRLAGIPLTEDQQRWLDQWKEDLDAAGAVVYYDRDTEEGFFWIPRTKEHGDSLVDVPDKAKPPRSGGAAKRSAS